MIKYLIDRVPKEFSENNFAEFYWNVTGDDWKTLIQKSSATIALQQPSGINETICFTGAHGSKAQDCVARMENGQVVFTTTKPLLSGQGLTVDYGFDKEIVKTFQFEDVEKFKKLKNDIESIKQGSREISKSISKTFLSDLIRLLKKALLLFFAPLVLFLGIFLKKEKEAFDKPIIPKYHPPKNLHPTLIGTIIDGKYDKNDFVAGIIDLAVSNLITIENKNSGYSLKATSKNNFNSNLQKTFYNTLLEHKIISTGKKKSRPLSQKADNLFQVFFEIEKYIKNTRYFGFIEKVRLKTKDIDFKLRHFRNVYWAILITIALFAVLLTFNSASFDKILLIFSLLISLFIAYKIYPSRTKEGTALAHGAKCYREFLETADIDKLNWAEKQEIFEKNLPYAVAFGLTKKWTEVFGNQISVPQFIKYNSPRKFNKVIESIISNISKNIKSSHNQFFTASKSGFSSSGGFSGGGSGGGGGGSW